MLVYSVSSLPSFEMVQVIRDKILNHLVSIPTYIFTLMVSNATQRAASGYRLLSLETKVIYVQSSDKSVLKTGRSCVRSINAPGLKLALVIMRMYQRHLSSFSAKLRRLKMQEERLQTHKSAL